MAKKKTHEEFLIEVNDKFGNIFSFITKYDGAKNPLKFKCNLCGYEHNSQPTNILNNMTGCSNYLCDNYNGNKKRTNPKHYIDLLYKYHGDSISIISPEMIVNAKTKTDLICNDCKFIWNVPINHLVHGSRRTGCPNCNNTSSLEMIVKKYLEELNVSYKREYRIITKGSYRPRYDFYLPDYNLVIEVHGAQHYRPIDFFGGQEAFIKCVKNDQIKKEICQNKNIRYAEISYKDIESNEYKNILKDSIFNDYPEREYT